jgi:transposase
VPGRKTDVKDSDWLAQLVRHGLLRPSVVLPRPLRALRDLVRARRKLIESRTTERNRLLKLLETANVKLASVVSDVFGVSGLRMLRALAAGETDPARLANEARGSLRGKRPALLAALTARIEPHHRILLTLHLAPYAAAHARLQQIPGVGPEVAAVLLAELGDDMTVFGDVHQVAAWVGICPGNNESAGKHRSTRIRKGNVALTTALVEAAQAAARTRGTYLREKFSSPAGAAGLQARHRRGGPQNPDRRVPSPRRLAASRQTPVIQIRPVVLGLVPTEPARGAWHASGDRRSARRSAP